MKQSLSCLWVFTLAVACSSSTGSTGSSPASGGSAGTVASAGKGGVSSGGGAGAASSGAGASGTTTATGGNGGTGGGTSAGAGGASGSGGASASAGAGGAATTGFKCPAGPFDAPILTGTAKRIAGAPPSDDFNKNGFGNVEGPVWIGDSLYFSEMQDGSLPLARILKLSPGGVVTVAVTDSGSNGMAVDANGNLFAAVHKDGSISQVALPSGPEMAVVSKYMGSRFISPNDLAIRSDGTIYFSDPNYQNDTDPPPQSAQRLYRVTPAPERAVSVISDSPNPPNGVTLSPDEHTLYVSGGGLKKFTVAADGSVSGGVDFVVGSGGDGMVVDCSGNLYVAGSPGNGIRVYAPTGTPLGTIAVDTGGATPTNVAFGGTDHKTLYITAQGNDGQRGVFSIALNVPGYPY
jgi:gluconolactonase